VESTPGAHISAFFLNNFINFLLMMQESIGDLENSKWFRQMAAYSLGPPGETLSDVKTDPDFHLIPLVVEMAVLPRLTSEYILIFYH
jgi:hypothetical protein